MKQPKRDNARAAVLSTDAPTLREYQADLTRVLGPVVGGAELTAALGFRTQGAFRKARERGCLPVKTFIVEGRRGRFAATADIAAWLWAQRQGASE